MDLPSHPQLVGLRVGLEPVSWVVLYQRRRYVDPEPQVSRINSLRNLAHKESMAEIGGASSCWTTFQVHGGSAAIRAGIQ